jgi:transposase-like protein
MLIEPLCFATVSETKSCYGANWSIPHDVPLYADTLEDDAEARLNHLKVPARHRQYGRTSNLAEHVFEEERRRTKVIPPLWDEASLVKLVFTVLIHVSERWG